MGFREGGRVFIPTFAEVVGDFSFESGKACVVRIA
jgi:hypothetical protein